MTPATPAGRLAPRLRALVAAPVAHIDRDDLRQLAGVGAVILVIGAAVGVQMWARTAVTEAAAALGQARVEVREAERLRARLELERAMLRQPGRLQARADAAGLGWPVAVIDLGSGASR